MCGLDVGGCRGVEVRNKEKEKASGEKKSLEKTILIEDFSALNLKSDRYGERKRERYLGELGDS